MFYINIQKNFLKSVTRMVSECKCSLLTFFIQKIFSISENNDSEAFYKTSFILTIVLGKNNIRKKLSFRKWSVPLGSKSQKFHIYFLNSIKNRLKKKVSCEISNQINIDIIFHFTVLVNLLISQINTILFS